MKTVERFIDREQHPLAPAIVIAFVSVGRLILESSLGDSAVNTIAVLHGLVITGTFYLATFLLFCLLIRLALGLSFEQASKVSSVGLFFGLLPPLLDMLLGTADKGRYVYFSDFTFSLFAHDQPFGESIVLWALIAACGFFGFIVTRSFFRAFCALVGAYMVIQACSGLGILIQKSTPRADLWTVVSIPKDYKDVEADRRAGIPTYYVVLTGKGKSELAVHRWIVACVAICLLVPPVGLLVFFPSSWAAWLLLPLALCPGAALLLVEDRRRSLSVMLFFLTVYLFFLAVGVNGIGSEIDRSCNRV